MRELVVAESARPVMNLVPRPTPAITSGWGVFFSAGVGSITHPVTGDAPLGRPYVRYTFTEAPPSANLTIGFGTGGQRVPLVDGQLYSASMWARASWAAEVRIRVRFYATDGSSVDVYGAPIRVAANSWARVSLSSFVPPAGMVSAVVFVNSTTGVPAPPAGATLDATMAHVWEGSRHLEYSDGDTPGWRWLFGAGNSQSVGYPYTLESIAGSPIASFYEAGTVSLADRGIPNGTPVSMFAVIDIPALFEPNAYPNVGRYGTAPFPGNADPIEEVWLRAGRGSTEAMFAQTRVTGGAGPVAHALSIGRNVMAGGVDTDGALFAKCGIPEGRTVRDTSALRHNRLTVDSGGPRSIVAVHAWLNMNRTTRDSVARWLANAYGVPLA